MPERGAPSERRRQTCAALPHPHCVILRRWPWASRVYTRLCRFTLARTMGPGTRLCSELFEVSGQLFRLELYPAGVGEDSRRSARAAAAAPFAPCCGCSLCWPPVWHKVPRRLWCMWLRSASEWPRGCIHMPGVEGSCLLHTHSVTGRKQSVGPCAPDPARPPARRYVGIFLTTPGSTSARHLLYDVEVMDQVSGAGPALSTCGGHAHDASFASAPAGTRTCMPLECDRGPFESMCMPPTRACGGRTLGSMHGQGSS